MEIRSSTSRRVRPLRILALVALAAVVVTGGAVLTAEILDRSSSGPSAPSAQGDGPRVDASATSEPSSDQPTWPSAGTAAIAFGDEDPVVSSSAALPMASVSKVITALLVLEERPLAPGEVGGDYWFTQKWQDEYEQYIARGESALKVPVDGMLSQRQLLQGMLIGSACNYADILVESVWGDHAAFAAAADDFLADHGIDGIAMVEPTGIDPRNTATPGALVGVGQLALDNPVISEIVAKRSVDIPGAGHVESTNDLLADSGVVGIKTGTLEGSNLLSAKDISVNGETIRVFAVVMGQPDDEARFTASRELYREAEGIFAGR